MADRSVSRRNVLKLGGTVSLAAVAGCSGNPLSDNSSGGSDISSVIPAGANLIVEADVETLLGDESIREQYETAISELSSGVGPEITISDLEGRLQTEFGLDPKEASKLLMYSDVETEDGAAIVTAEWSEDQLQSAFSAGEGSYEGQSVYETDELAVGVLPDGRYVFGPSATTRTIIDVQQGNESGVDGEIDAGFDSAPAGFIRFSFVPPENFTPATDAPFDLSSFGEISYGYGSVSRNSNTTSGELLLETTSPDAATQIEQATTGALGMGARAIAEDESIPEELGTVLESTTVFQSGTTVGVENNDGRGYLLLVPMAIIASFVLELGNESSARPPNFNFDAEYDPERATMTVVATTADADNRAGDIMIRGETPDAGDRWHELTDASPSSADEPITAGDTATIDGVDDGDEILVVYETGSDSTVLFSQEAGSDR